MVGAQACPDVLGVCSFGGGGEVDQITEENGDDLALLQRSSD